MAELYMNLLSCRLFLDLFRRRTNAILAPPKQRAGNCKHGQHKTHDASENSRPPAENISGMHLSIPLTEKACRHMHHTGAARVEHRPRIRVKEDEGTSERSSVLGILQPNAINPACARHINLRHARTGKQ